MKYIETLNSGETFTVKEDHWFVTSDFKKNGQRLCYNLSSGKPRWFNANDVVDINPIYVIDKDNNITPIKIYTNENSNFS